MNNAFFQEDFDEQSVFIVFLRQQHEPGTDGKTLPRSDRIGRCSSVEPSPCGKRLYADIDFVSGATVEGVLYLISEANLTRLDACEGYPKVYRLLWLEVEFDGGIYQAITYEMSRWTKFIRRRKRYPEEYRKICSFGADYYGIKNNFKK